MKKSNRNIFRSIYINMYRKKLVIENNLSISYRRDKSMHYPESPKVTSSPHESIINTPRQKTNKAKIRRYAHACSLNGDCYRKIKIKLVERAETRVPK